MKTTFYCPYCGMKNTHTPGFIESTKTKLVVSCDIEKGGCDKDFVLIFWAELKAEVKEIK